MNRVLRSTGTVAQLSGGESPAGALLRQALLVHSGPNGSEIVFQSSDGEIKFDEERIKNIVGQQNAKIEALAESYGGLDKMPIGAFPPILDQHSDASSLGIGGRLKGLLRFEERDVPGVGEKCACVVGDIMFLGEESIERVLDGRIYHLSIGIDEETDTLSEVSTVIEPAAPGAMVLNKRQNKGVMKMATKKKLKALHDKRSALEAKIKEETKSLSARLVTTKESVSLAKRESQVVKRLSACMKAGKLTAAEFKKQDVKKLAKLDAETLDTVIGAIESMEPKVLIGQRGSSSASEFSEMGKSLEKRQRARLKAETRKDLKRMGVKLKDDEDEDKEMSEFGGEDTKKMKSEEVNPGKDPSAVPGEMKLSSHMAKLAKCLEDGDMEGAKSAHKDLSECMGSHKEMSMGDEEGADEKEKHMSDVEKKVDELSTNLGRLAGMVDELMSVGKEESEMADGEDDDAEMAEGDEKDKVKKELGLDEEEEKKKKMADKSKQEQAQA